MELAVGQSEVVVAMAGDNGFIDIAYIIDEVGDLLAILVGQAITGGVGDIDTVAPAVMTLL